MSDMIQVRIRKKMVIYANPIEWDTDSSLI